MTDGTTSLTETLLWGPTDDPVRHVVLFVGGYVAPFVGLFGLMLLADALGRDDVAAALYEPVLFPTLVFHSPPLVGLLNGVLGGGLLGGAVIGVTPALSVTSMLGFGWTIRYLRTGSPPRGGDSPLWALSLFFAGYGVVGSLVGTLVGMALRVGRSVF
ncbi:hypothetical protein SAMN04487950_1237 [Halogranum rubrum]|uniref:Uncharacterized protein n=1 Tax=Halogranum rubrum TaxID=553466 RepID=A0A1I4CN31_9EURY|nr:hypothetical protein [Halogranum rubrum]SFK81687.1 hypothetical protein SAMN04487950_1237 [Halogranum rubrum]